ncbi:hypothetical protein Pdw03_1555 [Penicillium digitatum]|uniref:Uncharacterized protein n=3 Tax=Penicillium digitatum TaxID=36651 RepID=K9FUA7_PEND2|nr:hypothetical protein PDIP_06560 [Penicillium digitatum Pd1]EKV12714.1 hypothetical protein PDIG_41500 [Penicillium digitatum PHI26]EKV21447.1 hypothetical protein PDIP_06560 [Penicillium digitatum Pd1]KAG0155426.1 hypothetical protein PDIDSM_1003 [Penicillium digitatum]QQK46657.1 hypothetical protein Pdw03_1555 [Penicillium digitatum]
MAILARDSVYWRERTYYLDLLQTQVVQLRSVPDCRLHVVDRLRELAQMTPGYIEASLLVGDTIFHRICCALQPLLPTAIATVSRDFDPVSGYRVADVLEGTVLLEIRDPFNHPAIW